MGVVPVARSRGSARWCLIAIAFLALSPPAPAQDAGEPGADVREEPAPPPAAGDLSDSLFLGYQSEPGMDFGGRSVASLHSLLSGFVGSIGNLEGHPGVAPAWEFPLAAALLLVQRVLVSRAALHATD